MTLEHEGGMVSRAEARSKPFHLLGSGIVIERLSPLAIEVQTDKLVYRPGQPGQVSVTCRNEGPQAVKAAFVAELLSGLREPVRLAAGTLEIAAGETSTRRLNTPIDTSGLYWGAEVRVRAEAAGMPPAEGRAIFAVSNNIWETAIIGSGGHTAVCDDPDRARAAAREMRRQGFTGCEAFFWGPCDMFDFTPKTEQFYSGQAGYPGTIRGTRNLVAACHEEGLCTTFYANLWGGSGPPAIELMRPARMVRQRQLQHAGAQRLGPAGLGRDADGRPQDSHARHRHVVFQPTHPRAAGGCLSLARPGNRRQPEDVRLGRHSLRLVLQPLLEHAGDAADPRVGRRAGARLPVRLQLVRLGRLQGRGLGRHARRRRDGHGRRHPAGAPPGISPPSPGRCSPGAT